jgi:MoxR-like ATPase
MSDKKSCQVCPSFLRAEEVTNRFGKATGVPMCGTFGTVLGKPGAKPSQNKKIWEAKAENCPGFAQPMSPAAERNMNVVFPDPVVRDPNNIDENLKTACTSCVMCKNFVPEAEVVKEFGFSTGLCSAKGKLILSTKVSIEARDCEYRQFGPVRGSVGGLHFLQEYTDEFLTGVPNQVEEFFRQRKAEFVEPDAYLTDRSVSPEDKAAGISAWRKFTDPGGSGNDVYFPIYYREFFTEEEQKLIPKTGSDEHPELYVDHFGGMYGLGVAWFELDETPVMWGQPGVGKTELYRYAAWIMQVPFRRISFTRSTELDDIAGKMMYDAERGTYFEYGRLPKAWTRPGVLCLDEPNTSRPEVWQYVRPLTDNSKQLVNDMNKGETLDRNDGCYMGMAMNPAWDIRNIGALEIADADANRLFHTHLELPPPLLEREIIKSYVKLDGWELSDDQLNHVMKTATDIRNLSNEQGLSISWAIRQQIKAARALRWFAPTTAYRRAVGDYLDPQERQILLDQVRANFPDSDDDDSDNSNDPGGVF